MKWPSKEERQRFEIEGFIKLYKSFERGKGRSFVIDQYRDQPDFVLRDRNTGERFGVELTSVYLSNRSVPDEHMKNEDVWIGIPFSQDDLNRYEKKIIEAVEKKVIKANTARYDNSWPLILSIYLNEYISIYMDRRYWTSFRDKYSNQLDAIEPFFEVVFWPLPNNEALSFRKK
jgi:hypothetical protein